MLAIKSKFSYGEERVIIYRDSHVFHFKNEPSSTIIL